MRIEVRFVEDVPFVTLSGKFLAGSDGPFLRQKVSDLIEAGTRSLVIDFAEVPYIDSTGLGFLAGARTSAEQAGVALILSGINPHVKKVLDGVQLTQFFVLANDEVAALAMAKEKTQPAGDSGKTPTKEGRGKKRPAEPGA
ncbi:MAG: STAS domain-containing protein [Acidobacteria bacterium]|nr:STAS domain-containing protein [Acidobacteriota bacterium]MBI1984421.1 STAS domain-containing protein [Acidobacteriota bacterium]